jgi:hypothetical protein
MGAGVDDLVPAQIETLCPDTVMVPVAIVGHVPLTAGILGPEPVVVIEPLLLPLPLPLPPACASAPPELDDDTWLEPELLLYDDPLLLVDDPPVPLLLLPLSPLLLPEPEPEELPLPPPLLLPFPLLP